MEDDSKSKVIVGGFLGAIGLGAVATAVAVPKYGLWLGLAIIVLALLIFGAYFLYRRMKARRQSRNFEGAIEAQTSASPRAISDPNRRAALDKLRQKFQSGLQEYKSRGKDVYKLPWYVIIGEPGSGKSEAIRHSGIDFPPGLQDELQGSGGTVNMDWWFTNRSIILDTAGSMIFNEAQAGEAPEWREFLRLLKKARPHCPINGFFLVLSVESLIKDSAEKIAQKASKLAQQLDLIQRTLDVRFPVYLLVTKCDLLTGFREFFDNIEDPLLQHQIFGWSNPDPLDSAFRPELVEQHLKIVSERVRRRRLALLRESGTAERFGDTQFFVSKTQPGAATKRRLDEVDSLYALPESVMRLAPRLRRYLETIFVAGEWSAKPVFLRGIYFTSSMREGRALDEAMALAAGVSLDQLPEDRSWEKNRSFFMRDLFMEKVFREHGLVTRATNTLQLLRQRKLIIFGSASLALLFLLGFSFLSYRSLKKSVKDELGCWNAGADPTKWSDEREWSPRIVQAGVSGDSFHFAYYGETNVPGTPFTVVQFHKHLLEVTDKPLSVGWIFKPMQWINRGIDKDRKEAPRLLLEAGVLKPLVARTREKMKSPAVSPAGPAALALHREALLTLIKLESGGNLATTNSAAAIARFVNTLQSYLTDTNQPADTNLVGVIQSTYAGSKSTSAKWPPPSLLGGNSLTNNSAVKIGLDTFRKANRSTQDSIASEAGMVSELADSLRDYHQKETDWQLGSGDPCAALIPGGSLQAAKQKVDEAWLKLQASTNLVNSPQTNLTARYLVLETAAKDASANLFKGIAEDIPDSSKTSGLFAEIELLIKSFASESAGTVHQSYLSRSNWLAELDRTQLTLVKQGQTAHAARWSLYTNACELAQQTEPVDENIIGTEWKNLVGLKRKSDAFLIQLAAYNGPLADTTSNICQRIAGDSVLKIKGQLVDDYAKLAVKLLEKNFDLSRWSAANAAVSSNLLAKIGRDLQAATEKNFSPEDLAKLKPVSQSLLASAVQLRGKLGFPILLKSEKEMSSADLSALKNLLPPVMAALKEPAWNGVLDETTRTKVTKDLQSYSNVVASLWNADGKLATVNVLFIPPKAGSADVGLINVFRYWEFQLKDAPSAFQRLDDKIDGVELVKNGALDAGLSIAYRKLLTDGLAPVPAEHEESWALLRLIRTGKMQRSDNGLEWILNIKLKDAAQSIDGTVSFKIVTERPLPKSEDWPQD